MAKQRIVSFHKMIPNFITLTALAAGMTSIKFAIVGKWELAVLAIMIAAFMDAFDGAAARLLKAESKLGAELDSFSDFLCFGVAPALLIFLWTLQDAGRWGWSVALIFVIAVVLRLARFNIATEDDHDTPPAQKYFSGVPSPIGALLALQPLLLSFQIDNPEVLHRPELISAWMLIIAAMMVSSIPTLSTKQIRVPIRMKAVAMAVFGIFIVAIINSTWTTLTVFGMGYLLLMPFGIRHYQKNKDTTVEDE